MPDGRFAPSPTAPLHLGNLRTALLAWLFARSSGSRFLVRVEDLDPVASREEHVVGHLADLAALGLEWDGPVVRQSDRRPQHGAALEQLVADGWTYPCFCSRKEIAEAVAAPHGEVEGGRYPGTCRHLSAAEQADRIAAGRRPALRLRADGIRVTAVDRLLGELDVEVDDFVVRRADGVPAYNLAVVVDDADQGIGEVVRGDDLWPTTPRQVHIAHLLGRPVPAYAHVPLVLGADGERLSKRHGSVTLAQRLAGGTDAVGVRSLLAASVGLCRPGDRPGLDDLLAGFDPARLPRQSGVLPDL
ncbi:MAG TPA: tRNA glutamyl-Q(34) synthetase GluQRS [Acidimicrobiales bacterium]